MRLDFLDMQVLYVEGGARTANPYFLQVCREPDCAVMSICPSWTTQRVCRVALNPSR